MDPPSSCGRDHLRGVQERRHRLGPLSVVVLALGALTAWPPWTLRPGHDIDPSWQVALHLAHQAHLSWGRDVLFSYGPLGFIDVPSVLTRSSLPLGLLYGALCVLLVVLVPFYGLRDMSVWPSLAITFAFCLLAPTALFVPEVISFGAFAGALFVFAQPTGKPLTAIAAALGALLAVQFLVKPPTAAAVVLAIVVLTLTDAPGKLRRAGSALATFVVGMIVIWFLLGQTLAHFPSWIHGTLQVGLGYSEAMAIDEPGRGWEYVEALVLVALLVYFVRSCASFSGTRAAWIVNLSLGIAVWVAFKEGFVRHDVHSAIFFFSVALLATAVPRRAGRIWPLLAVVVAGLVFTADAAQPLGVAPVSSAGSFFALVETIVSEEHRAELAVEGRDRVRSFMGVPDEVLADLEGHTVHVDPTETGLVSAYGLDWRPIPVFQRYSAYTAYLDELGASALRGPRAPERILRSTALVIDGRNTFWDSPRTMLEIVCRYRQGPASARWGSFARGPSRCGREQPLGTVRFSANERIAVPVAPDDSSIVVARFHFSVPIVQRLEATLLRPFNTLSIVAGGRRYRVARPDVAGPLLVRATSKLGWAPGFGGDVDYRSLYPSLGGSVDFSAIPIGAARSRGDG